MAFSRFFAPRGVPPANGVPSYTVWFYSMIYNIIHSITYSIISPGGAERPLGLCGVSNAVYNAVNHAVDHTVYSVDSENHPR